MENKVTRDSKWMGIIIGILLPVVVFYVYYYVSLSKALSFSEALAKFKTSNQFVTAVSTVLILVNALLFGLLIQFRKMQTAIGVFIPTVIFGIATLAYKLLG
jgi:fatty acid desaturase